VAIPERTECVMERNEYAYARESKGRASVLALEKSMELTSNRKESGPLAIHGSLAMNSTTVTQSFHVVVPSQRYLSLVQQTTSTVV